MATTTEQIAGFLTAAKVPHKVRDDGSIHLIGGLDNYRDPKGEEGLLIVIRLFEDGEYVRVECPRAYELKGQHADLALRVCAIIQWRTKLIQFEFDESDGELRAVIEFPLEDALLTQKQITRCVNALCGLIDQYHEAISKALTEGVVALPMPPQPPGTSDSLMRMALIALLAEGRPETDPQVVALRALISAGGGAQPPAGSRGGSAPSAL